MIAALIAGNLAVIGGVVVWARRQAKKYPDRPPEPCAKCAAIEELSEDGPLDDKVIETLREAYAFPQITPVSQKEVDAKPKYFPSTAPHRFAVWSRGFVDSTTDDPGVAKKAWNRVIGRTGIHQFWDREHSIERPRTEKTIPLSVGDV